MAASTSPLSTRPLGPLPWIAAALMWGFSCSRRMTAGPARRFEGIGWDEAAGAGGDAVGAGEGGAALIAGVAAAVVLGDPL